MSRPRKVTDEDVAAILAWYADYKALPSKRKIAKRHGISQSMLDKICAGYQYKVKVTQAEIDGCVELLRTSNSFTSNCEIPTKTQEIGCTTARS